MGIKEWLIKKLEKDVGNSYGYINIEEMDEQERNEMFVQFGEGDENLSEFLKTAYENGAPSIYSCSGHGVKSPYVVLKVNDDNIELLKKVGKILSKNNIVTNFTDDYKKGKHVSYRSMDSVSSEWLSLAARIMENPELFEDVEPSIYYHEEMFSTSKPFGYELKKKLLTFLRGERKELVAPNGNENSGSGKGDLKDIIVDQETQNKLAEIGREATTPGENNGEKYGAKPIKEEK